MVAFVKHELEFILDHIVISEQHAEQSQGPRLEASRDALLNLPPNSLVSQGLRTVDGSLDNLRPGPLESGAQDTVFARVSAPVFRVAEVLAFDPDGPGPQAAVDPTSYDRTSGFAVDSAPRRVSNSLRQPHRIDGCCHRYLYALGSS